MSHDKIQVKTPIVEMDGDEMTRVMWGWVKEELLAPYINIPTQYFDLALTERDRTLDQVTRDAAEAIKLHGVGVKCATITPNKQRVAEYSLQRPLEGFESPNIIIRRELDGTVFRAPIRVENIEPANRLWEQPIVVARHAFGDIYVGKESIVPQGANAYMVITDGSGQEIERKQVGNFSNGPGIVQSIYNFDNSIRSFAQSCFRYAYEQGLPLWFGTKDTISKTYHGRFKDIFQEVYTKEGWEKRLAEKGSSYSYFLIDDMAAGMTKSKGGMVLALMNYDGDVWSDMIATGFGSLGLMTSVLVSPDGKYEFEAAHGTVTRHYREHQKGNETSTNPVALIYAWTGALKKRGELDGTPEVVNFANQLEGAVVDTIHCGIMTKDLIPSAKPSPDNQVVTTRQYLAAVKERLEQRLYTPS